jgi:hypothetical protein
MIGMNEDTQESDDTWQAVGAVAAGLLGKILRRQVERLATLTGPVGPEVDALALRQAGGCASVRPLTFRGPAPDVELAKPVDCSLETDIPSQECSDLCNGGAFVRHAASDHQLLGARLATSTNSARCFQIAIAVDRETGFERRAHAAPA